MRNGGHINGVDATRAQAKVGEPKIPIPIPRPSASYRRRAWAEFQRALDPLARLKPLRRPRG